MSAPRELTEEDRVYSKVFASKEPPKQINPRELAASVRQLVRLLKDFDK